MTQEYLRAIAGSGLGDGITTFGRIGLLGNLLLVRLHGVDGPIQIVHDHTGTTRTEGDVLLVAPTQEGPGLTGYRVVEHDRCTPLLTPRGHVFMEAIGVDGAASSGDPNWFWIKTDDTIVNIGKPPLQVTGSIGQRGIVRGDDLYLTMQPSGGLDRFGRIYKYSTVGGTWTLLTYPTVSGLPASTRLQATHWFIDRAGIIWLGTTSASAPANTSYLFTLGLDDVISYVATNVASDGFTNNEAAFQIGSPGATAANDRRIIALYGQESAGLGATWRANAAQVDSGAVVITPIDPPDGLLGEIVYVDQQCAYTLIFAGMTIYRSTGVAFPMTLTVENYHGTVPLMGDANPTSEVFGVYPYAGRFYAIRRDSFIAGVTPVDVNIWDATDFYEPASWSVVPDIYTVGEIVAGGFRGIWAMRVDGSHLIQSGGGSGSQYFFTVGADEGVMPYGGFVLDLDTEVVTHIIDATRFDPLAGSRSAVGLITHYEQGNFGR